MMKNDMVELWLTLREDQTNLKSGIATINNFLKRADFKTEDDYYQLLYTRY